MTRAEEIGAFLAREGWGWAERTPLAGDASARRYERLRRGFQRAILMDMPPESGLDVRPFLAVTAWLRAGRFSAPEVLGADRARGLVLLEDLGDDLFATLCAEHPNREPGLYRAAVEALADLQRRPPPGEDVGWTPPPYDLAFLMREVRLVPEWYLPAATGAPVPPDLAAEYDALAETALLAVATPQVPVLRDYHAENLLWLPRRRNHARVGMLDYQDMLLGHPAYDLDLAPRGRPPRHHALRSAPPCSPATSSSPAPTPRPSPPHASLLAAQRNLKILGLFTRLCRRDGKPRYLAHLPRVWAHLTRDLAHPALAPLAAFVARHVPAPTPEVLARVEAGA